MSLCKLVVEDYLCKIEPDQDWRDYYSKYDLEKWAEFVREDIENGKKRNWWYKFNNKAFLYFVNEQIKTLKKEEANANR